MKPIPELDLKSLTNEATKAVLNDSAVAVVTQIKEDLKQIVKLTAHINTMEHTLEQKKKELEKLQAKVEALKNGDWSVLKEPKEESEKGGDGKKPPPEQPKGYDFR